MSMYDILNKLKTVTDTAALTPDTPLNESAEPKGKLAEQIAKLEAQYAEIKEGSMTSIFDPHPEDGPGEWPKSKQHYRSDPEWEPAEYNEPNLDDDEDELDESAAPGQEDWIKANKAQFIKQYGKEKGLEVLYATAWKRAGKKDESVEESAYHDADFVNNTERHERLRAKAKREGNKAEFDKHNDALKKLYGKDNVVDATPDGQFNEGMVNKMIGKKKITESVETFDHILKRFPYEVKQFEKTGEIDPDLFDAMYDYYANSGEMPYGVMKARSGDPMEWVCQRLERDLGITEGSDFFHNPDVPASEQLPPPPEEVEVTLEDELNEIAKLAGINQPEDDFPPASPHEEPIVLEQEEDEEELDEGAKSAPRGSNALFKAGQSATKNMKKAEQKKKEEDKKEVKEDINVNITASGDEDAITLIRKLAGLQAGEEEQEHAVAVIAQPEVVDAPLEEEDRDIEYTNTPNEKIAGIAAAIPSGTDLHRSKEQDPATANKAANPLEEQKLWKKYSDMLKGITK